MCRNDRLATQVEAALAALPQRERQVFIGIRDEGLDYAALAIRLSIDAEEVEQAFASALIRLDRSTRQQPFTGIIGRAGCRIMAALGLSPRPPER